MPEWKRPDASGKKVKLSWCKCIFDQIEGNLTKIQPKNHQNVQETPFLQKAPRVNGLKKLSWGILCLVIRISWQVRRKGLLHENGMDIFFNHTIRVSESDMITFDLFPEHFV